MEAIVLRQWHDGDHTWRWQHRGTIIKPRVAIGTGHRGGSVEAVVLSGPSEKVAVLRWYQGSVVEPGVIMLRRYSHILLFFR